MIAAIFGLIGVVLGAVLTIGGEWWVRRQAETKELEYLSIQISCMLDNFALLCEEVVFDDGLYHGQRLADGCKSAQVPLPVFEPLSTDVDWKSLPLEMMYEILSLPNEIREANRRIFSVEEFAASPPNYEEYFEARQQEYANIGIKAAKLAECLRKIANLEGQGQIEHDLVQCLSEKISAINMVKEKRFAKLESNA